MQINPKDVLFFDRMLTPSIITIVYWLLLAGVVLSALGVMFTQSLFGGLGMLIGGVIGVRIWCELLIVIFKIHQNLQTFVEKSE